MTALTHLEAALEAVRCIKALEDLLHSTRDLHLVNPVNLALLLGAVRGQLKARIEHAAGQPVPCGSK